jgi:hypothetical protein
LPVKNSPALQFAPCYQPWCPTIFYGVFTFSGNSNIVDGRGKFPNAGIPVTADYLCSLLLKTAQHVFY